MRLKITLKADKPHTFTKDYNEALTALIYRLITDGDKTFGEELHDNGYRQLGSKRFNYFTYSRLMSEKMEWIDKYIPSGNIIWYFTSMSDDIVINFMRGLQKRDTLQIYDFNPFIREVSIIKERPNFARGAIFTTLSPITMAVRGNNNLPIFLEPEMMASKLETNLIEKYYALFNAVPKEMKLQMQFLNCDKMFIQYKETTMQAYKAHVAMTGSPELVRIAYECGLGSKNSQGFGMLATV